MHSHNPCEKLSLCQAPIHERRSSHRNVPVQHPSLWRILADLFLSPPMRLHRYRKLSVRMFEDTLKKLDDRECR